jgi:hypothetical protein
LNAALCSKTKLDLKIRDLVVMREDRYATTPLGIVLPRQLPIDEEVIYSSFEEALSDRLIALNDHWNYRSDCQLTSIQQEPSYATNPLLVAQSRTDTEPLTFQFHQIARIWPRWMIFGCLALMLLMIGFDLMGLLILHIR